ncbi:carboxypeptidase regulatory-like domain-containing protein [Candidatus Poribacteria bacterium]|nr:carboxypeptidase regulatory-like domain-containing protein [Candidatus Poribacteria bacterium]
MKESPTHIVDGEYITEWLVLGPFFPDDLNTDFLADVGGEANIQPNEGDTVNLTPRPPSLRGKGENSPPRLGEGLGERSGTTLTWKRYRAPGNHIIINLLDAVGDYTNVTAYAFCLLQSEPSPPAPLPEGEGGRGKAEIRLGSDEGVALWVNGKQVHTYPNHRTFALDKDVFEVDLKVGLNRCLIKVFRDMMLWNFAIRVTMLPENSAVLGGTITDESRKAIPNADVLLEREGLEIARTKTDEQGSYRIRLFPPVRGRYDLSATESHRGDWQFGIPLCEGEHRTLNLTLKEAVSIEGTLLMLDNATPHVAVVVQALRMSDVGCRIEKEGFKNPHSAIGSRCHDVER